MLSVVLKLTNHKNGVPLVSFIMKAVVAFEITDYDHF